MDHGQDSNRLEFQLFHFWALVLFLRMVISGSKRAFSVNVEKSLALLFLVTLFSHTIEANKIVLSKNFI